MIMSEKCKQHVDSCRFCWMCHHICPVGNATGQERNTARARALGISLVNREAIDLSEIMDNVYECATCGACVHDCVTGWDPVMFTKETRLQAALEDKLPPYINKLVDKCLDTGNAYGKTELCDRLKAAIANHSAKTDTLFYIGVDARYMACEQALKAIKVMERSGAEFTVLADEPASGGQLDFLIGAANETRDQMVACAKVLDEYKNVVVYDPADSKTIKQLYKEYGIETSANVLTYTAYLADAVENGKLSAAKSEKTVSVQDPYQLARDLEETEELRKVVSAFAEIKELHLNRAETVWAGNVLMAQYMPEIIDLVAKRRIFNATSLDIKTIVTACVGEYIALKSVAQSDVEILSLEDLIIG